MLRVTIGFAAAQVVYTHTHTAGGPYIVHAGAKVASQNPVPKHGLHVCGYLSMTYYTCKLHTWS